MQKLAWKLASVALVWIIAVQAVLRSDDIAIKSSTIGTPARLEVFPPAVKLSGQRSRLQLVVTGHYADGSVRDLTRDSQFASTASDVVTAEGSLVLPQRDGKADIAIIVGGRAAVIPVEVTSCEQQQPVSFEFDTLAALSKQGCNSGACHGSPSGKGGFRLSLRAFDPALDKLTLIREDL